MVMVMVWKKVQLPQAHSRIVLHVKEAKMKHWRGNMAFSLSLYYSEISE